MSTIKKTIIVGISDAKISRSPDEVVATYSLGSCIGICLHDKRRSIGGMLHFQLPESKLNEAKAQTQPFMFADTGLAKLLDGLERQGASKRDLTVKIAGGASMQNGPSNFDIGNRNILAIRKGLWKAGLIISGADVGGDVARTLYLDISTGIVTIKVSGTEKEL